MTNKHLQRYENEQTADVETSLDITRMPAIVQSGDASFQEFVRALAIISQHANIYVDIGKGSLDATVNALKGKMNGITGVVFPYLDKRGADAPHEWGDESHGGWLKQLQDWLEKDIPDLKDRYRDFPHLVRALEYIGTLAEHGTDVKQFFRDNMTPDQLAQLKDMYDATFRKGPSVDVKRSDVANEQQRLQLQIVKAELEGSVRGLLGGS